jgi:hypothetical protein
MTQAFNPACERFGDLASISRGGVTGVSEDVQRLCVKECKLFL